MPNYTYPTGGETCTEWNYVGNCKISCTKTTCKTKRANTQTYDFKIVAPGTTLNTTSNDSNRTQTPAEGKTVKCINDNRTFRYNSERDMLMNYPNDAIRNTWTSENNDGFYNCNNNSGYTRGTSYTTNTFNMAAKPTNDSVVKCSNDNMYYKYNENENKVYKFATTNDANQHISANIQQTIIQTNEIDIGNSTSMFQNIPRYDSSKVPAYTFYFECCIEKSYSGWRNIMNHSNDANDAINKNSRRPAVFISNGNQIYVVHGNDGNDDANMLSSFRITPARWFRCCIIVNRKSLFTYFSNDGEPLNRDTTYTSSHNFNWGTPSNTNWRWNIYGNTRPNGYIKIRNAVFWPYAMALDHPQTFVPTNNITSASTVDCRQYSKKPSNNSVVKCTNLGNKYYVYNSANNSLTNYPSKTVIKQYINSYVDGSETVEECDMYKINTSTMPQLLPQDNMTVKFDGETDYYIYKDSKVHRYPNTSIALLNDPNYISNSNDPKNILDRTATSASMIGTDVKWPLANYDVISCNTKTGYSSSDYYYYNDTSGTITKYPTQSSQSEKTLLQNWLQDWGEPQMPNPYYNCDTVFGSVNPTSSNIIPQKIDLIKCENRTDTKTYTKYNVGGIIYQNQPAKNSSCKYFKYNQTTKKFDRYADDDVARFYHPDLNVAKIITDCNILNRNSDDTIILYPDPTNNTIIKCTNETTVPFPYYKYDSTNKKLNKYPVQNVAERVDPSYLSNKRDYNCNFLKLDNPNGVINYPTPPAQTIVKCSNEPDSSYPYYLYNNQTNKLDKYPTEDVLNSWYTPPYQSETYNCSYLPIEKGFDLSYNPPLNGTTIKCSENQSEPFPYYRYNDQILSKYKDITALFTWAKDKVSNNNVVNVRPYNCNYLTHQAGTIIDNKTNTDNMNIYCSNDPQYQSQTQTLYKYNDSLLRPYNASTIITWNADVDTVANCQSYLTGTPLYDISMETLHSFTTDPFLKISRGGNISYFVLNNQDNSCNLIPNNYTPLTNDTDYDKYYSIDKEVSLFTNGDCTIEANNNSNITKTTEKNYKVGTLRYKDDQNSTYYKLSR